MQLFSTTNFFIFIRNKDRGISSNRIGSFLYATLFYQKIFYFYTQQGSRIFFYFIIRITRTLKLVIIFDYLPFFTRKTTNVNTLCKPLPIKLDFAKADSNKINEKCILSTKKLYNVIKFFFVTK